MQIKINDRNITLGRGEVKQARRICTQFLSSIEAIATKHAQKSFYFTTLVVMHVLTQQLLDEIDTETLSKYMKIINEIRENPRS